ncbi:MarR family transcriptional regulator [Phenylobacterium sp. LjRoot225]|uniref:MarR family winged helix-turn-helix transcriptional regulator n=1 Tax=Phenylobacterium sp. LjRoot225 TaxID=3342285 RepID=UPI003ECD865C
MTGAVSEPTVASSPLDERKMAMGVKLTVIARQLWLDFDQDAEKIGLTRAKWSVVAEANRAPGATQRMIAMRLQVTDVTAGRLIDRLCAEGLLERHENPEDRRAYRVYPTEKAQPVLAQLQELAASHAREAFAGFQTEDLAELEGLLDAISRNLGKTRG